MPAAAPPVTGCVLAGGQGRRLDGADKGLVECAGRPLIAWCVERLRPQVAEIVISANRNRERYRRWAEVVFGDDLDGYAGPLAGLHGALGRARHAWVVTAPCDSPFLPHDVVARLWRAIVERDAELAVVRSNGRLQPVFALVPVRLRDSLADYLDAGERKIDRWFARHRLAEADYGTVEDFANVNTAAELEQARKRLEGHAARG